MTGVFGSLNPASNTDTTLFTVPSGKKITANLSVCNRGKGLAKVSVALCDSDNPTLADYIEYECVIPANGVLERSALVLQNNKKIVVKATTENVSFVLYGLEGING